MKLILDVKCINSNYWDAPATYIATLSEKEIARIIELSQLVKDNNLYSVECLDSSGHFYNEESDNITDNTDSARVVCVCIVVTAEEFYFYGVPKHQSDSCAIRTDKVSIFRLTK